MRRAGHRVVEVNRGDRRTRRAAGKSDTIDAEVAARSVLAGQSTAILKTADSAVEMMRQLKITRDTAVKARTTAMNTLKQIVVHASPVLREALHNLTDHGLLTRCAGLRPGPLDTPTAAAKHTLRALARRWMALTEEMAIHDQHLARLTTETSPTLREGFGVGAHSAAELLIIFGDNPDRIRSEAAFAKLCGAWKPVPRPKRPKASLKPSLPKVSFLSLSCFLSSVCCSGFSHQNSSEKGKLASTREKRRTRPSSRNCGSADAQLPPW